MIDEITITRGDTVIADGDPRGKGVVEELLVNGQAVLDVALFIFAVGPTIFDRDGRINTLQLKIFRESSSMVGALNRHLTAPLAYTGVADLVIGLTEDEVLYEWKVAGAGWSPIGGSNLVGVSGVLGYTITCGPFESGFDEAGNPILFNAGTPILNAGEQVSNA